MKAFCATDLNEDTDDTLVTTAKHGDNQAFEKLVLRHQPRVLAVAQRITNNWEDAEDVAQESFHKAFLHLKDFQEKSRFSTWLTRITINEAFMSLRRKRGVFEVLPESADDGKCSSELFVDQSPNPEESCWRRERTDFLAKAINCLSPTIGRTILLRDIEEKSVEETAKLLGTSISAVRRRVFHGRRKLRRTLNTWLPSGGYESRGIAQGFF